MNRTQMTEKPFGRRLNSSMHANRKMAPQSSLMNNTSQGKLSHTESKGMLFNRTAACSSKQIRHSRYPSQVINEGIKPGFDFSAIRQSH